MNPKLHPIKNMEITQEYINKYPGSSKKVWWICVTNPKHEWEATISNVIKRGSRCSACLGMVASEDYNFALLHPALLTQWDYEKNILKPNSYTPKSSKKVYWKCSLGHSWEAAINERTSHDRTKCPKCSGKIPSIEYNLKIKYPDIVSSWDYEKNNSLPEDFTPHSGKRVYWKCSLGHSWEARIIDRTSGYGCPSCSGRIATKENNLVVVCPELLTQWDYEKNDRDPITLTPRSHYLVWWKCSNNHSWQSTLNSRNKNGIIAKCIKCSGKVASEISNFALAFPNLLIEWDYKNNIKEPSEYTPSSHSIVNWVCKSNHSWQASINNRTNHGSSCPKCFFKENKLESKFIEIMSDFFPNLKKFDKEYSSDIPYKPDFKLEKNNKIIFVNTDGLFWHSELRRKKQYHKEIKESFENQGLSILQFYEDEVHSKSNIVRSIVLSKLGLLSKKYMARKCAIKQITYKESNKFFVENHLMGGCKASRSFGLFYKEELVAAISYRKRGNDTVEIARFCNKINTTVNGGFSKLLNCIKKEINFMGIKYIESFCDLRYADGSSYEKIGFKKTNTHLSFYWTDKYSRYSRYACRAGNGKTEAENAAEKGWVKIYDAGQAKYVLNLKKEEIETEEESLKRMDVDYDPWIEAPLTEQEKEAFNKDHKEEDEL